MEEEGIIIIIIIITTTTTTTTVSWITKATDTHSEDATLIAFPQQYGDANLPQCYNIWALHVLERTVLSWH